MMMTVLLWSRPVFAVILLAVVATLVWTGRKADALGHRPFKS